MSRLRNALENLVIVAIVLVLVQTFLEDLAILVGWSWDVRRVLLFTGFAFDLFFTVEFLTRLYFAFVNRRTGIYFWYERGWVDLLASVPLLLLSSGPAVLAYWSGTATVVGLAGILNVLKVVKAIRIARILRLLRVLKVFARIRNTDSTMAQRHVAKISTVAVTVVVVGVLLMTILFTMLGASGLEARYQEQTLDLLNEIDEYDLTDAADLESLRGLADIEESILVVQRAGRTVYSRHETEYYDEYFGPTDYGYGERDAIRVFFDLRPVNQEQSRANLLYFAVIVFLVLALLFYYTPHFALTVSDPIHVMRRGMNEKGYNLEVKIPRFYQDDEVYRLARLFNEIYLPLKDRATGGDDSEVLDLKMDDIRDMLNEE
ncbi:MAG: ion transporter [Spirochaetota bacterium]